MMQIELPNTVGLMKDCWCKAEEDGSNHLVTYGLHSGEEFITELFSGFLTKRLQEATESRNLAHAFESDLIQAIPTLNRSDERLQECSNHLFMQCDKHSKWREGKYGGDFGLTIIRPHLSLTLYSASIAMSRQGLLCQAKLLSRRGKWGTLSANQKKVLPESLSFTALTLYSYSDDGVLKPFQWQQCSGATIDTVSEWLKRGSFGAVELSDRMIRALADARIGTSNQDLIDTKIATKQRPVISIRIGWPDDRKPPPLEQLVENRHRAVEKAYVYVRQ